MKNENGIKTDKSFLKGILMKALIILFINFLFITTAYSGVALTGTRIIFADGQAEKTLYFQNNGDIPSVVQVWTDNGDENSTIDKAGHSFIVNPQIFRMAGNTGQSVRLIFLDGKVVPQNKESLFFLNFMEIPMKKESDIENNQLSFLFKNRIKILYRPKGLKGTASESINKLTFKVESNNGGNYLNIHNPTDYYVNFNNLDIGYSNQYFSVESGNKILPPQSNVNWKISSDFKFGQTAEVKFSIVNDYGAIVHHKVKLN